MTPRCHPSGTLLAHFARGHLSLAPAVAVSAHIETCIKCQVDVARLESKEGGELDSRPAVTMSADALAATLARLDLPVDKNEPARARELGDVTLPNAAWQAGVGSRRWAGGELWAAPISTGWHDDWRAFVLRVPPGTVIPRHGHQGGELVAVLAGGYHDGTAYAAGDFSENSADQHHQLVVDNSGPCACLVAVQGNVRWRGWAKVITPLLGI